MDADWFPREITIQIRTGGYIIRQLSDCAFLVQNWNPQYPLHKNFTLIGRQYISDEPMTRER